ncbi:LuxR C-terminal-related transcriptional regulator [Arthrobacter sp.]|uniref:LuxR C-terminal-related transcriptional regulator n=1 Tax=Arthrobacter sp. TaxID=1667 RepID=UPI0033962379
MVNHIIRVGVVDDHPMLGVGFAAAAHLDARTATVPVKVILASDTVDGLLAAGERIYDVVALDLSLADGSHLGGNVRKILDAGYPVLVYSQAANAADVREALAAGASGVSKKTEDYARTLDLIRRVADGEVIDNQELAAAIDGDAAFVATADLTGREREALAWYAAGFTRTQVAERMNVTTNTVGTWVRRIKKKYEAVGREAGNKTELYRRAVEDGILTQNGGVPTSLFAATLAKAERYRPFSKVKRRP